MDWRFRENGGFNPIDIGIGELEGFTAGIVGDGCASLHDSGKDIAKH